MAVFGELLDGSGCIGGAGLPKFRGQQRRNKGRSNEVPRTAA